MYNENVSNSKKTKENQEMAKKGFGKVQFIAREEVKSGYLLRENQGGMVLEYYDPNQNTVDTVAEFPNAHIENCSAFDQALYESRMYIGCFNEPLQVDLNTQKE